MARITNQQAYTAAILLALVLICALMLLLSGGKLDNVVIVRQNAENSIADISDERIIRESGLVMGEKIPDIDEIAKSVEYGVNSIGYIKFVSMKRTSRNVIEITVDYRKPFALIDTVGKYVLIDREGYVITHLDSIPAYDVLYVTGVDLIDHTEGRIITTRKVKQFDVMRTITEAIADAGYQRLFTEINVSDEHDLRLITNTDMLVSFYTTDNIMKTLEMAKSVIDQGRIGGRLIISGNYADYKPQPSGYSTKD